ncbi:hypothetical protein CXQ85_001292 [Candidozyma haemuli]|uniref:Something about silencing protein 4 domain-containing protein n=1 Tax=Candidozyma haemuli TaxID=45357 RepID=A0A2V1AMD1_9ASCO|nr:hypothetical protein CXQ85_001292 [[Candida] haemuloni]PVH18998.1 hypothetical protein CXQ85_001292 [[Candida] haemuloni]
MEEKEKRRLRSQERSKAASKLFDFDSANALLYKDEAIRIDRSGRSEGRQPFTYYGEMSRLPERQATSKSTKVSKKEVVLPRRQRTKEDPLGDEVYEAFHRKMKRDEKSMTGSDKNRIANEIDNFRMQLMLLQQNNWARHLPKMTYINDKSDLEELSWKRQATFKELQRLVQKYENWETRNEQRLAEIKEFESRRDPDAPDSEPVDEDDADDAILAQPSVQEEREQERLEELGPSSRLILLP